MTTEIPYRSTANATTINKQTNIPRDWTAATYTILVDDTAEVLPCVGDILMARLVAGSSNVGQVYVGPSNVSSTLFASNLSQNEVTDISIDRLEHIYVYGKAADTVNYIYFIGKQ